MRTRFLFVLIAMAMPYAFAEDAAKPAQWLVEKIDGTWEIREAHQTKARALNGKHEVVTTADKIRCMKGPCILTCSMRGGAQKAMPLPKPMRMGQWLPVSEPPESPVQQAIAELNSAVATTAIIGGAQKGIDPCSDSRLRLVAPTCYETVTPKSLRLQWKVDPADTERNLALVVGGVGSFKMWRQNRIAAKAGAFEAAGLTEYLATLQEPDRAVDITVRLILTQSQDAVRMLRLISRSDEKRYEAELSEIASFPALARSLRLLEISINRQMWSQAAELGRTLLADAPNSIELRKYALVALCHSKSNDEIVALRTQLKDVGVKEYCAEEEPKP